MSRRANAPECNILRRRLLTQLGNLSDPNINASSEPTYCIRSYSSNDNNQLTTPWPTPKRNKRRFKTPDWLIPEIHICTKDLIISLPAGQRSNNHEIKLPQLPNREVNQKTRRKKKKKKKGKLLRRTDHIFYNNAHWLSNRSDPPVVRVAADPEPRAC